MINYKTVDLDEFDEIIRLRMEFIREDMGPQTAETERTIQAQLREYLKNHLNRDCYVFAAVEDDRIISIAFLLIQERPANPRFPHGRTGNIMNVYTNPEMIKQKYHNSFYMTLLTTARTQNNNLQDSFTFELVLLGSSSLLDYYVSSSPTGRVVNSPLLINMTVCTEPYYVIFNYNSPDTRKTLILDEIYGKLKSFGIATQLTQDNWKDMTDYDIKAVNIEDRKYELPANSPNHIDVYKLECTLPIMLNFYYIDDTSQSSKMGEGDVHIFILEPYETLNVPFVSGVSAPEIVIEIHHPENTPNVQIKVADLDEKIYTENTLDRFVPMTISNGITIRELGALSSTRIIIKV